MRILDEIAFWLRMRPRILSLGEARFGPAPRIARAGELKRRYVEGLAKAIGVRPEEIREDVVERWLVHWLRAIIKPEYWEKYGLI